MNRQRKWVTLLLVVALCAQVGGLVSAEPEWEDLEPEWVDLETEWTDIGWEMNETLTHPGLAEPLSSGLPYTGEAPVGAVVSTEWTIPHDDCVDTSGCYYTETPNAYTFVTEEETTETVTVTETFTGWSEGTDSAVVPPLAGETERETLEWIDQLGKRPALTLVKVDSPLGLSWTSIEGADRYVLELTIVSTDGVSHRQNVTVAQNGYTFTQDILNGAQSITAVAYAQRPDICMHSGVAQASERSNVVTCTLGQQGGNDQTQQEKQEKEEEKKLQTPILSFDPSTLTFTWTEVPGAHAYELDLAVDRGASHMESFPITIAAGFGCFYQLADPNMFEGMLAVYANIYARTEDGKSSETSNEVGYEFEIPTPVQDAPVLSFTPDTLTFTWTEVPGAAAYKLSLELSYADRAPHKWTVSEVDECAYTLENMDGATGVTGYVEVCLPDGTYGERSNVVQYAFDAMIDDEETEWEDLSITEYGRPVTNQAYIDEVVRLVNVERAKAGLSPLSGGHSALNASAIARAQEVVTLFSHQRPDGTSFTTAMDKFGATGGYKGENIAWGSNTPKGVVEQWMNSKGHRENILNPEFQYIGVGHAAILGSNYWVQVFLSNPEYKAPDNTITSFALNGHSGTVNGNRISVVVPNDTDVTRLAATSIVHTGESVTPAIGEAQDFSRPVTYTVSSGGTENTYMVKVLFSSVTSQDNPSSGTGGSNAGNNNGSNGGNSNGSNAENKTGNDRNTLLALNGGRGDEASSRTAAVTAQESKSREDAAEKIGGSVETWLDEGQEYVRITSNTVNVRSAPTGRRTNPLGEVQRGDMAIVLGRVLNEEGAFVEISTQEGLIGFIPEEYVELCGLESDMSSHTVFIWTDGESSFRADRNASAAPDSIHEARLGSIEFTDGEPVSREGDIPEHVYQHFAGVYTK